MGRASLRQGDTIVAQGAEVDVHSGRIGGTGALKMILKLSSSFSTIKNSLQRTCRHIATLTLHPNEVETALGERFSPEKSFANEFARAILGLSSATTTHVRMHERSTPRDLREGTEPPRPFVHSSITPLGEKY